MALHDVHRSVYPLFFCDQCISLVPSSLCIACHTHSIGSVLCSIQHPVKVATKFEARIIVFNIEVPITIGYPVS